MSIRHEGREHERLRDLVREYERKGYSVVEPRGRKDLPAFLRESGYLPDLIVHAGDRHMVVEIKSAGTARELDQHAKVADLVNSEPNWEFVLVMTNPRRTSNLETEVNTMELHDRIQRIRSWIPNDETQSEARLLLAWSMLEAALRSALRRSGTSARVRSGPTLLREAAMLGLIDRDSAMAATSAAEARNRLVHGYKSDIPTNYQVEELLQLALELLESTTETENS